MRSLIQRAMVLLVATLLATCDGTTDPTTTTTTPPPEWIVGYWQGPAMEYYPVARDSSTGFFWIRFSQEPRDSVQGTGYWIDFAVPGDTFGPLHLNGSFVSRNTIEGEAHHNVNNCDARVRWSGRVTLNHDVEHPDGSIVISYSGTSRCVVGDTISRGNLLLTLRDVELEDLYARADSALRYTLSVLQSSWDRENLTYDVLLNLVLCEGDRNLQCAHRPSLDSVASFASRLQGYANMVGNWQSQIAWLKDSYAARDVSRASLILQLHELVSAVLGVGNTYAGYHAEQDSVLARFRLALRECQNPLQPYSCH